MLSEQAIENDKKLGLPLIEVKKIYADIEFNCRGAFGAAEVVELARDIATRGLVEPIIIRKLWPDQEKLIIAQGYEYSLVAGFRRHYAYRVNEAEVIPCIIRDINSEFDCRDINAVENLQRLDLNLLQEANSIKHYINADWTREDIARRINKSPGWVQIRAQLLQLPEEIQTAAAQGYILQADVMDLYKLRNNKDELLRVAGVIRDRRKMGQKKDVKKDVQKKYKAAEQKLRKPHEIMTVMDTVREICLNADRSKSVLVSELMSEQGNSIITRILGWATANASNIDLYSALDKFAKIIGAPYKMPEWE